MTTTTPTALFSVATNPQQCLAPKQRLIALRWSSAGRPSLTKSPLFIILPPLSASSPTSTSTSNSTSIVEQEEGSGSSPSDDQSELTDSLLLGGCKACGREEIERGCNGEGRMQGGIATVPGFGWWPIKAYRPCPGFVASGGRYRRQGQSMDEVAGFGRVERVASTVTADEAQSSGNKAGPRKFKSVKMVEATGIGNLKLIIEFLRDCNSQS